MTLAASFGWVLFVEPEPNEEWNNQEGVSLTVMLLAGIIGGTNTHDSFKSIKKTLSNRVVDIDKSPELARHIHTKNILKK